MLMVVAADETIFQSKICSCHKYYYVKNIVISKFDLLLGIIILALIAKYVEHWRYIQLALNIPTLATLLYIW